MTENKAKNEAPNELGWYWARWRGKDGKIGPWTACHTAELELRNEPELEWWHERLIDPDEAPAFVHRTRDGQPIPVNSPWGFVLACRAIGIRISIYAAFRILIARTPVELSDAVIAAWDDMDELRAILHHEVTSC